MAFIVYLYRLSVRRHRSEQYLTSDQHDAHLRRHANSLWHRKQVFIDKSAFRLIAISLKVQKRLLQRTVSFVGRLLGTRTKGKILPAAVLFLNCFRLFTEARLPPHGVDAFARLLCRSKMVHDRYRIISAESDSGCFLIKRTHAPGFMNVRCRDT